MKYKTEVTIDLPRDRVIELFDSLENLYKWQEGLKADEHLEGEPGQPGAKMKLVYDQNGRTMELTETIQVRNLPEEFSAVYEAPNVWNLNKNFFYDEGNKTRWVTDTEFKASGFMRVFMFLLPGMFKRQTLKMMEDFKAFAEQAG